MIGMVVSVISFSENGFLLSKRLAEAGRTKDGQCDRYRLFSKWGELPEQEIVAKAADLDKWTGQQFEGHHALLFIGACGIAVRSIAPYIRSKLTDSPVLVMDEKGKYIIPVLAGHVGGANRLAREIAGMLGAEAVLTTATDVNEKFAVDVFAAEQGFLIQNRERIERISAGILQGEQKSLAVEGLDARECLEFLRKRLGACPDEILPVSCGSGSKAEETVPDQADIVFSEQAPGRETVLWLKPKRYILGMGCKKGKLCGALLGLVRRELGRLGISESEVYALASIDRKEDEEGLQDLADYLRVPFYTYSEEQLAGLDGEYSPSEFVEKTVGVDNVCERAAFACCDEKGSFVLRKTAEDGMTLAIVKREWKV